VTVVVSARPANLERFVDDTRAASTTAQGDIARLRASWDAFAAADNEFGPADTGLLADGPEGVLGQHLDRWHRQEDFVDLVHRSFVAADEHGAHMIGRSPVLTMGDWRLEWHLQDQARRLRLDLTEMFTVPAALVVPPPLQATPIPHDSGFVEDPVCTATGFFVDTALDLAMPARLPMLAWPRVYSSGPGRDGGPGGGGLGGHGRGWGSWASVACGRRADGSLAYTGPDGQRLRLRPDRDGRGRVRSWRRTVWLRAAATPVSPDDGGESGVELRWDRESAYPGETWVFRPDGTLAEVRSPDHGTTAAAYDDGRLVGLRHEGGRHLDVHWQEDRIARVVSSCGRAVGYRYDGQGDLVEVVSARQPRRYDLDADGRIVAVWDGDGVRLCRTTYDHRGRVRRQESPFGRTTTFTYGDGGDDRVTVVADTDGGPVSRWEHDRQGRVVGLVDAEGHRMSRTFDAEGRCLSVTGFDGATVTYGYDDAGRLSRRRDDRGEERFHHDDQGRVVRHERPGGSWTAYEYDSGGDARPRRAHGPEGWEQIVDHRDGVVRRVVDADGVTLEIESDDAGCPTAVTDGLGRTTTFAVHPSGEVAAVTQPDGATWVVDRDAAGRPTAVTGADGHRTEIRWTPGGRLHEIVGPDGDRTRYHHGAHGEVDAVTDPRGRTVELAYDRLERLVGLASGEHRWGLQHSPRGLVETVRDPGGHAWRFDHDADGRTTALTDPLGHRHVYDHDALGDLVREVDAAGGITHHLRDAAGRVVAVVDPEGGTTRVGHDGLGRVVRVESPDGGVVERRYTPAGRLAEEVTGEGRGRRLRYDAAGRLVEEVDALGATTTYERDAVGRIVAVTGPDGRTGRLTYDAAGRVVATEVDGSVGRTVHDAEGRVTAVVDPLGSTTRFAYDAAGDLVAATDPLGHTTRYEWDD
jgi:YD repeat-containing protein